jgi:N-carbamoylputrescine amidase
VAIPTSFFEREGPHYYNTLAMIDADGEIMGTYRKSHIPDGPGYEEKYYFRPGNTGFKVWDVFGTRIGVGVCWDQWYPECARAMALMGAQVLFYPTAIGSEPYDADLDTSRVWRRAMLGHAASNCMPVVAANRIGVEENDQAFYGHSFIANEWGDFLADYGARKPACWSPRSIWKKPPATAPAWASSAIAARNSMAASHRISERCIAT